MSEHDSCPPGSGAGALRRPLGAGRLAGAHGQAAELVDGRHPRLLCAAIADADRALAHLRAFKLGEVPPAEERLLKLMLSLAEVGPAVEWFGDPHVYDGSMPPRSNTPG